jgi:hypothetical protein
MNKPKYIVVHCTDVSWQKLRNQLNSVNSYHKSIDFPKSQLGYFVGYHSLITGGVNYQCRRDSEVGAHTNQQENGQSINVQSLGVCVGFDGDIEYPHPDDYELLKKQVKGWQRMYSIPDEDVVFHRHFNKSKTCPGSLLGEEWLKTLLEEPIEKPDDQEEKKKEILKQQIVILTRLIDLITKLKNEFR